MDWLLGSVAHRAGHGATSAIPAILSYHFCVWKETEPLNSNSRITEGGEDCSCWGQMSTLDQSAMARGQPTVNNVTSAATVCVRACVACVCVRLKFPEKLALGRGEGDTGRQSNI